jgi:heme-degrading monooxygenase HmoA
MSGPAGHRGPSNQRQLLEEITESTKGAGMLRHRFVSGEGELVVIDEWDTAAQFQTFFDSNPKVAKVMESVGMTGRPAISVFEAIDAPGTI